MHNFQGMDAQKIVHRFFADLYAALIITVG